jgi:NADPH:quinone reductase-like Zn-dependent oxidoreductase
MTTMRAVRAHARGGPEQLRLDDVPKPETRHGEALIRVHAAGITPTELEWGETWVDRQGHDRTPTIPSHEVSGVVEELGHGVTHVVVGEEVYGLVPFDDDGRLRTTWWCELATWPRSRSRLITFGPRPCPCRR